MAKASQEFSAAAGSLGDHAALQVKRRKSYIEMILQAIEVLGDKNGATVKAIETYIKANFVVSLTANKMKKALINGLETRQLARPEGSNLSKAVLLGRYKKAGKTSSDTKKSAENQDTKVNAGPKDHESDSLEKQQTTADVSENVSVNMLLDLTEADEEGSRRPWTRAMNQFPLLENLNEPKTAGRLRLPKRKPKSASASISKESEIAPHFNDQRPSEDREATETGPSIERAQNQSKKANFSGQFKTKAVDLRKGQEDSNKRNVSVVLESSTSDSESMAGAMLASLLVHASSYSFPDSLTEVPKKGVRTRSKK